MAIFKRGIKALKSGFGKSPMVGKAAGAAPQKLGGLAGVLRKMGGGMRKV
jgi:hypothetical protein